MKKHIIGIASIITFGALIWWLFLKPPAQKGEYGGGIKEDKCGFIRRSIAFTGWSDEDF